MHKIDVIIPAYNEEGLIASTLNNIANQKFSGKYNYIIRLIANGCTDRTVEEANKAIRALKAHSFIEFAKVIVEPDALGKPMALNRGLELVTSDLIICIDADVLFSDHCFDEVCDMFEDEKILLSGAVPRTHIPDAIKDTLLGRFHRAQQIHIEASGKWLTPTGRMMAFRRNIVESFPRGVAEDGWLIYRTWLDHGMETIQLAQTASAYMIAQQTWVDLIRQQSRFKLHDIQLRERYPEFIPPMDIKRSIVRELLPTEEVIQSKIIPRFTRENLDLGLLNLVVQFQNIYTDNAHLMAEELLDSNGEWKPILSTKRNS